MAGITLSTHLRAVAYLRGRLFVNNFRRKGGAGELVARIIVYPIGFVCLIGPSIGAGAGAYAAVHYGKLPALAIVFWVITVLQILVSINLAPPGLSFDPESLIRFPLSFPRYLLIRILLGLLSASTIAGSCALLATAIGISLADLSLAPAAFAAAAALAVANMLLIRMIFAWVDRWLSTRRAREIFMGLIFAFGIGIQYLNITFNGLGKHVSHTEQAAKIAAVVRFVHNIQPLAAWLPPGLAAQTITSAAHGQWPLLLVALVGLALFSALFLAVFAWRTQVEFRGENLSDSVAPAQTVAAPKPVRTIATSKQATAGWANFGLPGPIAAVLTKEVLYIRRNAMIFFGLAAPLILVVLFVSKIQLLGSSGFAFPGGVAYAILGISAFAYNSFGLDQAGIQLYFLAPVTFRSILLAKNLLLFAIVFTQVALVYLVVLLAGGAPPLGITVMTVLWVIFAIVTGTLLGNYRSLVAAKKMDPGKMGRKQASQLSALMSVGVMFAACGIAIGLYVTGRLLHLSWLPIPVLFVLAAVALFGYLKMLDSCDRIARDNRESLIEELCKAS